MIINKNIEGTSFTNDQAARVYLWDKAGFQVPGLSKRDLKTLVDFVENDKENKDIRAFAETLGIASEQEAGYLEPSEFWMVENLQSDILKITNENGIMTRPAWRLLPKLQMFKNSPKMNLNVAESLERRLVNLPSSPSLI